MTVVNNIVYSDRPLLRVKSARPLDGYKLWVRFGSDEERVFDFLPLLTFPAYAPLRDKKVFDGVYVEYGCPVWQNGEIDIAPEKLYDEGVAADK